MMSMKYFKKIDSLETLKKEYRRLAHEWHPDLHPDNVEQCEEAMKIINGEFEVLFPIFKDKKSTESANSFRSEFYTQYGHKGSNYDMWLSTKEIAKRVRDYVKMAFPECKFSVSVSRGNGLNVVLIKSPYKKSKSFDELTEREMYDTQYSYCYRYGRSSTDSEKEQFLNNCYSYEIREVLSQVNAFVKSYHFSDCDGMIDYFDVNFWFHSCEVGKWDKPYVQDETLLSKKRKVVANI